MYTFWHLSMLILCSSLTRFESIQSLSFQAGS
ncbi:hypothetical protein CsSME_00051452 [Camellia sinensis var. sinensis]